MESTEAYHKPSRKMAAALGLFMPPAAMLYVARPGRAAIYLVLVIAVATLNLLVPRERQWAGAAATLLIALVCAVQAFRLARDFREVKRPWYSRGLGLVFVIAVFAALLVGMQACLFEVFRASAGSMAPSIEPGARFVVNKWGYGNYGAYGIHFARTPRSVELNRGEIVVFEYPEDKSVEVKRIVGLPGDTVAYFSKRLWVNDQEMPRKRIGDYVEKGHVAGSPQYLERLGESEYPILVETEIAFTPPTKTFPLQDRCTYTKEGVSCRVPPSHYFVLGDNRDHSDDSRAWGFVPAANIVGKVQYIIP